MRLIIPDPSDAFENSHNIGFSIQQDGSKAFFKGNPTFTSHDKLLKPHQVQRGPLKKIVSDHGNLPSAKDNILELVHDFVNQFLSGGYNGISFVVKWLLFFTSFLLLLVLHYCASCKCIVYQF